MNKQQSLRYLILLSVLIVLFGCREQFKPAIWDVDLLIPLAEGKLQLQDLAKDDILTEDTKKLFHLIYSEEVFNIGVDTLIEIPDTTIKDEFAIPIGGVYIFGGVPFRNEVNETRYNLKGVQLLEAIIQSSVIEVEIENTLNARMLLSYRILSAELNGVVFSVDEFIDPNSSLVKQYSLDGYELDLRGVDQNSSNILTTEITIMLDPADSAYQLQAGDLFKIENTFKNFVPSYARGYFGDQVFDFEDVTEIEGFGQIPSGRIDFTKFDVSLDIVNGIGADLTLNVQSIQSSNALNTNSTLLSHPIVGNDIFIGRSSFVDLETVQKVTEVVTFTEENSNLDELIEIRPEFLSYDLGIRINPLGNISLGNDFIVFGQNLSANLRLDVPLIVGLEGLELVDTLAFSFDREAENDPLDQVNYGSLNIYVKNAYPIQAGIQLYMQDEQGVVFDSLLTSEQWIESGGLNSNGRVTDTTASQIVVPINQLRFDQLEKTASLRFVAHLNTPEADSVELYSDGFLGVKIIGDFNANSR